MTRTSFVSTIVVALFLMIAAPQSLFSQSPGESVFKTKCQVCHGPTGSGDTVMGKRLGAKDLKSEEVQKQSDAELANFIKTGKGKMVGFGTKLSADDIKSLVAYIRELGKKK
jgi:mono/diheme cytochrome c family protein